jgi:hypothetical protein
VWRHPVLKILVALYIGWGAWDWFRNRPVGEPDGVLAPADPIQTPVAAGESLVIQGWNLTVRAHYVIDARVLGLERYRFDSISNLVPEDLALGWGPMSDNRVLRRVDISQSNRFYFWRLESGALTTQEALITHSANTHVIPADVSVARQLASLRRGEVVTLTGELVDAHKDGGSIVTSLVRNDTGPGACEVMLVREVSVRGR